MTNPQHPKGTHVYVEREPAPKGDGPFHVTKPVTRGAVVDYKATLHALAWEHGHLLKVLKQKEGLLKEACDERDDLRKGLHTSFQNAEMYRRDSLRLQSALTNFKNAVLKHPIAVWLLPRSIW